MKWNHLTYWIGIFLAAVPAAAQSASNSQNLSPAALDFRAKVENVPEIPFESVPGFFKLPLNLFLGEGIGGAPGQGTQGDSFSRPTDVAWGSKGSAPGQFAMPNSVAVDTQGNVDVADLGNRRIQVFDNDGNYKSQIADVGAPWAICISPRGTPVSL